MMIDAYVLTVVVRSLAALGFVVAAVVLWRARNTDGPVVNAFAWTWATSTVAACWQIVLSLMLATDCCAAWLHMMIDHGWVIWAPCLVASWRLVAVLRRVLW